MPGRRFLVCIILASTSVNASGCQDLFLGDKPDVPDEYPQLGRYDDGRAELVIGGERYTADESGMTHVDTTGIDTERLRASVGFDYIFHLEFLDAQPGTYTVEDGELTASYNEENLGTFEADTSCGRGTLTVAGRGDDGGSYGDGVIWGTIQLELCDRDAPSSTLEISGRFSSIVIE